MFTRRTLLKRTGCAVLATAVPILIRPARAQSTSYDFYISPTGSDSNPGTFANPWSITALNSHRASYAGKSVGVLPGTYNVYALCQAGNYLIPALGIAGGPSGSPTLIQSTIPRAAIITALNPSGGGYPTSGGSVIGQGANSGISQLGNVIIDGLHISGGASYGICFYLVSQPEGSGVSGIEVRNCEVENIGGAVDNNVSGVFVQGVLGAWIHNNKIHNVQPNPQGGNIQDVAGIYSYYSQSNIYEYNTIYDCNQALRDKETSNGNHTFRYNYVEINGAYPVAGLGDSAGGNAGDTATFYNNIFNVIGAGAQGWYGNFWSLGHQDPNFDWHNNTMIIPAGGGGPQLTANGTSHGSVKCYNNVTLVKGGAAQGGNGIVSVKPGAVTIMDYNIWGAGSASQANLCQGSPGSATGFTFSNWQGLGYDAHGAAVDPSFVNAVTLNPAGFALIAGTAGSASGSHPGRVGGVSSGALCDMGAWGGASPPTQIGCNFGPIPNPPVIISVT